MNYKEITNDASPMCVREKEDEQIIRNIRKCSMTGRPCGDDRFMKKLEKLFGRRLRALPWGRPRKNNK